MQHHSSYDTTQRLNLKHTGKQHHQFSAAHSRPYPRHADRRTIRHSLICQLVPYSFSFTLTRLPLIPLACLLSKCLEHTLITPTHRTHSRHTHLRPTHRTQPLLQPFTLVRLPLTPRSLAHSLACHYSNARPLITSTHVASIPTQLRATSLSHKETHSRLAYLIARSVFRGRVGESIPAGVAVS